MIRATVTRFCSDAKILSVCTNRSAANPDSQPLIAPGELEEIIKGTSPDILEVAVVGKNDDEVGSLITAFVVKKPGSNLTENDIKNFMAKKNLHDSKELRGGVIFVDEIPKNSNGKFDRKKLGEIVNRPS